MSTNTNSYDLKIEEPKQELDLKAILRFTANIIVRVKSQSKDTQDFIKKCLEPSN